MSKTYELRLDGKVFTGVDLREVKSILTARYSADYAEALLSDVLAADLQTRVKTLTAEVASTLKAIREACDELDEEFARWVVSLKKSGPAVASADTCAESARPSSARATTQTES